ncbi:MAG TPA: ABC transporter substrate-binding protein [Xanthobacteraceae bacterium]|jgi:ABC-type nitrate/sulfonate/bicarbonate transport system substrate-binding protein
MKLSRRAFVGAATGAALARPAILAAAEPLVFGCVPANSVHWIACAAVERGFFKNVGFEAEIGVIQSSPQSMQMLITGAYQISSTQPEAAVAAIERGANLAAISAPMNRADWVLAGAAGIQSLGDLKGKIIGVSSLRISEVWLTAQLLEQAGLKKDDYSFIGVGTSPLKVTALQKGSIAAAVLFRPSADLALREGFADLARYSGMRDYPTVLYITGRDWAAKGDAGKRAAQAIQDGHRWLWDPQNKNAAIEILAKYTKRDQAICAAVYDDYFVKEKTYSRTGEISLAGLKNLLDDVAADGDIFKPPAPPAGKYVLDKGLGGLAS